MARYVVDFETRSDLAIDVGLPNYFNSPNSDIICCGFRDLDSMEVSLWIAGDPLPPQVRHPETHTFYAHNAWFDYNAWTILGSRLYDFPMVDLDQWVDIMAICCRFTFPAELAHVGSILKLRTQKDPRGKTLIKKITQPPFKYTHAELIDFYEYCLRDVNTEAALLMALPASALSPEEQQVWIDTQRRNARGLPVDIKSIAQIMKVSAQYAEMRSKDMKVITGGEVNTPNQVQAIVNWINRRGVAIPNLQKATVDLWLQMALPDDVRKALELRQHLAKTSVAKYRKLYALAHKGWIYDNEVYHKAATGRFAGRAFQAHNLPRAKVVDPEQAIKDFFSYDILDQDVLHIASALLRPMIKAPEGKVLLVADYNKVEYVGACWLANEAFGLKLIRDGEDPYIDMAASKELFDVPKAEVTKDQRQMSKPVVLGGIYGLGGMGLVEYAKTYGVDLTVEDADTAIKAFRARYKKVNGARYALKDASLRAVDSKSQCATHKCLFKYVVDRTGRSWLQLTLPSGRALYYCEPEVFDDRYGPVVRHMGINSYTNKWEWLTITPSRVIENVVQAMCRDILVNGCRQLEQAGFSTHLTVHDEFVCIETDAGELENQENLNKMCTVLSEPPSWCPDFPLGADGYVARRYRKD